MTAESPAVIVLWFLEKSSWPWFEQVEVSPHAERHHRAGHSDPALLSIFIQSELARRVVRAFTLRQVYRAACSALLGQRGLSRADARYRESAALVHRRALPLRTRRVERYRPSPSRQRVGGPATSSSCRSPSDATHPRNTFIPCRPRAPRRSARHSPLATPERSLSTSARLLLNARAGFGARLGLVAIR